MLKPLLVVVRRGPTAAVMKKIREIFNTPDVCQFQLSHGRKLVTCLQCPNLLLLPERYMLVFLWEKTLKRYLQFQPCHTRGINLPWVCGERNPALFCASMIKSADRYQYFVQLNLKLLPTINQIIIYKLGNSSILLQS